jgi:hypothetical protein
MIYKLHLNFSDTPIGWQKLINSLNIPACASRCDRHCEIVKALAVYNATWHPRKNDQTRSSIEFNDGKGYTLFLLKFGTMETQLDDL